MPGDNSYKGNTDGKYGPYQKLKDRVWTVGHKNVNESYNSEPYSAQAVRASIVAEPFHSLSDDKIHLRIGLEKGRIRYVTSSSC